MHRTNALWYNDSTIRLCRMLSRRQSHRQQPTQQLRLLYQWKFVEKTTKQKQNKTNKTYQCRSQSTYVAQGSQRHQVAATRWATMDRSRGRNHYDATANRSSKKTKFWNQTTTTNISNDAVVSYRCERSSVARQVMPPFVNRRTDARKIELMSSNVGLCEREKNKTTNWYQTIFFFNRLV